MELLTGQQQQHPPGRALDIPGPLVQRQVRGSCRPRFKCEQCNYWVTSHQHTTADVL
jgi:hypothetical protein